MECLKLLDNVELIGYAGICIPLEKAVLLQNSLIVLQNENRFKKCFYWGRINGVRNDYHIAYGYQTECLKGQIYFYSTDCINWLLLPEVNKCAIFLTTLATTDFQGDPTLSTNVYDTNPYEDDQSVGSTQSEVSITKYLKEEDRLSATVKLINNDAVVVLRGSWMKTIDGKIVENPSFEGLPIDEGDKLKSYLHARLPQNKWNENLLTRKDYNYSLDFLDPISEDVPKGCWNLQFGQGGHLVLLQNLFWKGSIFYHKISTPHFGFIYLGNGLKSMDLPFCC